ncbi:hypothetical protein DUI87_34670 [Hirundo rustica rustica]|uniref:RNase H type-1 domain-containing protein n=1 Tax=Hirundo rustica rustica TaxID=333673 RepID=A0A3M0IKT9_HIRRU|nr:hypothetical protein DUI87_34670 [Hirundo rustica rustica]
MACPGAFGRRCLGRLEADHWDSGPKATEGPKPTTLPQRRKSCLPMKEFKPPQRLHKPLKEKVGQANSLSSKLFNWPLDIAEREKWPKLYLYTDLWMVANALWGWLDRWKKANWQRRGKPIWAADEWKDIATRVERLPVKVCHVNAHVPKSQGNEEHRNNKQIELDKKFGLNDLVLIPEADINLLGRDLVLALGIKITPCEGKPKICSLTEEDHFEISDTLWYTGEVGKLNIQPISIEIQNPEIPIPVKQYLIALEGRKGLKLVVENSVHQGVLESCVSPHNTPILPVKKPDGSYRLLQDLRAINQRTITRFPGVAKPDTS